MNCRECRYWAGVHFLMGLPHHKNCSRYNPDTEQFIRGVLERARTAMCCWASDEDGLHPDAVASYDEISRMLGLPTAEDGK